MADSTTPDPAVPPSVQGDKNFIFTNSSNNTVTTDVHYGPGAHACDDEGRCGKEALETMQYGQALQCFKAAARKNPYSSELAYYRVLAALQRIRPKKHSKQTVAQMEELLYGAWRHDQDPRVAALWALIKEDRRYLDRSNPAHPAVTQLQHQVAEISPHAAAEIQYHVPAPECPTWTLLTP
ncbi:hypothetical protein AB0F17_49615 [Nonomuraea sp. NPDC026600]|uniref:hypothetical protein n=1 Tax=Nonomuraea sp. NPDC026600 TaxID=3155363 RepID=UPI0033C4F9C7